MRNYPMANRAQPIMQVVIFCRLACSHHTECKALSLILWVTHPSNLFSNVYWMVLHWLRSQVMKHHGSTAMCLLIKDSNNSSRIAGRASISRAVGLCIPLYRIWCDTTWINFAWLRYKWAIVEWMKLLMLLRQWNRNCVALHINRSSFMVLPLGWGNCRVWRRHDHASGACLSVTTCRLMSAIWRIY